MPVTNPDPTALSAAATKALNDVKAAVAGFATKTELEALQTKYAALQVQWDAMDIAGRERHAGGNFGGLTLEKLLTENESVSRFIKDRGRGRCVIKFEGAQEMAALYRKSIVSGTASGSASGDTLAPVGISTSGVLTIDRVPGITLEARQRLTIESVLSSAPTGQAAVDFVRVSSPMAIASPVPEASVKPEQSMSYTSHSEKVRTIAHWIPATRQVLDDLPSLMATIQGSLLYYLGLEVELQILSGDGTL